MVHLTMHSTHFIKGYMAADHSDNKRGNPLLLLHGVLFAISNKSFIYTPIDKIVHTTVFVTQVVENWLEREIYFWVHHEGLNQITHRKCHRV